MLIVLAKLGSPEMVGEFTLGLAISAPIFMFASMGVRGAQSTDVKRLFYFGHYFALRLINTILALLAIVVIVLIGGYNWHLSLVIMATSFAKGIESVSEVLVGLFQLNERMDYIAISQILKGIFGLTSIGILIYYTNDLLWAMLAFGLVMAVSLVGYDFRKGGVIFRLGAQNNPGGLRPIWEREKIIRLAIISLPLGFSTMLISLNTNIPRYFIEHKLGLKELGIFAAATHFLIAGKMFISAIGQAAIPRLAKYYADKNSKKFLELLLWLLVFGGILGVGGLGASLIAGREILTLFYRPEYGNYADILSILMLSGVSQYLALGAGCGIAAARYFKAYFILNIIVTATTFFSCLLLTNYFGLHGAAAAILAGATMQLICTIVILKIIWHNLKP